MTPEALMEAGKVLLRTKAIDYTSVGRYQNFERQSEIVSWFNNDIDKCFAGLVAVKLARLAALLDGRQDTPNHESITDTFIDLINYSALWGGYRTGERP